MVLRIFPFDIDDYKKDQRATRRFGVSGGVCPLKLLCEFASFVPAQAFVNRHPRQAAGTLAAICRVFSRNVSLQNQH
jgi:hypothetical protein